MSGSSDQRRYPRVLLSGAVRCSADPNLILFAPGGNVSQGGLYIHATSGLRTGTEVVLRFHLPFVGDLVETRGMVRWRSVNPQTSDVQGFGIEFVGLSPVARSQIERYTQAPG